MVTIRKASADEKGVGYRNATLYLVQKDGKTVALITKQKNTRCDIFPWMVFKMVPGAPSSLVATFYDDKDAAKIGATFDYDRCKIGGKASAFTFARRTF